LIVGEHVPATQEDIAPDALLSRQIFDPPMFPAGTLLAKFFFEFPGNQCESLIWQEKLPDGLQGVHRLGCEKQARDRKRQAVAGKEPTKAYVGAATARCAAIRAYRNPNGHGVKVLHDSSEGPYHVQICYDSADGARPMTTGDKTEIKLKLVEIFRDFSSHACSE
jgi:hypothetical protein